MNMSEEWHENLRFENENGIQRINGRVEYMYMIIRINFVSCRLVLDLMNKLYYLLAMIS